MLKIALCENDKAIIERFFNLINNYSLSCRKRFNIKVFSNMGDLLLSEIMFDVYVVNIKLQTKNYSGYQIRQKQPKVDIVYYIDDKNYVPPQHGFCPNSFLINNYENKRLIELLDYILSKKKKTYIIIDTPTGEVRKDAADLTYIDIEKRSLCYHFINEEKIFSKTLRGSFAKNIKGLLTEKDYYYFLNPSFVINLGQIYSMTNNKIVFVGKDELYFPKTRYEELNKAWKTYLFK